LFDLALISRNGCPLLILFLDGNGKSALWQESGACSVRQSVVAGFAAVHHMLAVERQAPAWHGTMAEWNSALRVSIGYRCNPCLLWLRFIVACKAGSASRFFG